MSTHESKTTTDHDTIRQWAEQRGGRPATVEGTADGELGVLRIKFDRDGGAQSLREVKWDDFFRKFDEENLAMVYQDEVEGGETSRFFKFVDRERAE